MSTPSGDRQADRFFVNLDKRATKPTGEIRWLSQRGRKRFNGSLDSVVENHVRDLRRVGKFSYI